MKITEDSVIQVYWYQKKKKAMVSKTEWTVQKDCVFIISNHEKNAPDHECSEVIVRYSYYLTDGQRHYLK